MELRWYQRAAVDAAWSWLCSKPGNPVIVLPTGAGKSLCIAELCRNAVAQYHGRVLMITHRKELIEQNAEKLRALNVPVGINSAGLRQRDYSSDVVFAGIQSVYKKASEFGERHLVLIDEAHLVPHHEEGMYRRFLGELREANPRLRIVGLTATPYRTDNGPLCRADAIFQGICYEAEIQRLITDGFLCPITNQPSATEFDTARLSIVRGEFSQGDMQLLFSERGKIKLAVAEIVAKAADRKSTLMFCSGVDHAIQVAEELEKHGSTGLVTGETIPLERAALLNRFKEQSLRFLVNVDVLTTGFDAPCIDCIAILRATMSPGLFAQMAGRGLRLHPSKSNTLLLDFGENIKRHGPIDAIDFGKESAKKAALGEGPVKGCPNCEAILPTGKRTCGCGYRFPDPPIARHEESSDGSSSVLSLPQSWEVLEVSAARHRKRKPTGPDTLRMDYLVRPLDSTGGNLEEQTISEWVCIEHRDFARVKAQLWWKARSRTNTPETIDDALDLINRGAVAAPKTITTKQDGRWKRIVSAELDDKPTDWADAVPNDPFTYEEVPF